jgi:glycine oxidase
MTDVAIVGAGLIGLALAAELAERGAAVTVYDAGEPGRGASWAGAGMLAPFSEDDGGTHDPALHALCVASLARYEPFVAHLRERSGVDPKLERTGTLHAASEPERLARLVAQAHRARAAGVAVTTLDRAAALAAEPLLGARTLGAIRFADEGRVDNRRLGRALLATCERLGVAIEREAAGIALEANARRALGVRTSRGYRAAGTVVNACGAWAGELAGVPAAHRVAVQPVAGEMLALAMPAGAMTSTVWVPGAYLVPRSDGRLLVGATVERRGFDVRVTAAGVRGLLDAALGAAPALGAFAVSETWAGLRPGSHDGRPYLGVTSLEGYVVAAGHYRNGILLAPITAAAVAAVVCGEAPPLDLAPFAPERPRPRVEAA